MLKGVPLVHVLLFLVNNLGVSREDNILDEVGRVVDFGLRRLFLDSVRTLSNLVFRLQLNHLSALADELEASRHQLCLFLLELLEPLQLYESHVFEGTLYGHVN